MSDARVVEGDYSKETALKSVELIMLLLSDAPLTRVLQAIEDFREAVEGEEVAQ